MSSNSTITLDSLRHKKAAVELLSEHFDLEIFPENEICDWFVIEPKQNYAVFGGEGAGGRFIQLESTGWVIYVSSEGSAGIISHGLPDFLYLVAACPYWSDILKFSGNGKLSEMRRVLPLLEESLIDDEPEIDGIRSTLKSSLNISSTADPVKTLHHAVSSTSSQITVKAMDGSSYDQLFNSFVIEDNPSWRNA